MSESTPVETATAPTSSSSFVVKAPFHSDSPGDCIIQTKDGTQFVVYRIILSLASSIWNDMFSLPQSSDHFDGEHPVIPVDEDPETMEALLTMLYPMQPPRIKSYDLAIQVVKACDKYFIDTARASAFLHDILRTTDALEKNPLGVYALAWRLKMGEEAQLASRYTHRLDLCDREVAQELVRRTGSLDAIMALWDLRRRREAALDAVAKLLDIDGKASSCYSHTNSVGQMMPVQVVSTYLQIRNSVKTSLESPYPVCKSRQEFFAYVPAVPYAGGCENCRQSHERKERETVTAAANAIANYPQTIEWTAS